MEPKNLFKIGKSNNLGQLLGQWRVKRLGSPLNVQIYQKGLVEILGLDLQRTMLYDFDLKFSFSKEPPQIKFQRGGQSCIYHLSTQSEVLIWRNSLRCRINQRGFHDQYLPIKKIGMGNFATVYLAHKIEDKTNYAVKAFSKRNSYAEDNGRECLVKQIQVMRCLDSRNTMRLYEVFQSENSLYVVFELLSGGQLYDKIKLKHKFQEGQTKLIMHGILKGLVEMHNKGIMHRDIKPQNLLLRKQGEWDCVIGDFGLAEFVNSETYLFVRCGTPGYVAPEVINIKDMKTKYSSICDMYSLGLVFHILLLGRSAFPGATYNEVLAQNRAANINLSSQEHKKLNFEAFDLLVKMLRKNPEQRITAVEALNHPYFKGVQFLKKQEIRQQLQSNKQNQNYLPSQSQYQNCNSPLLTSSNPKRRVDKTVKKDSCVQFQMGKENIVTGKTEEMDLFKVNKINILNTSTTIRKPKISHFHQPQQHK